MLNLVVHSVISGLGVWRQEIAVLDMRPDHCATKHKNRRQQNFTQDLYSLSKNCLISNLVGTEAIWTLDERQKAGNSWWGRGKARFEVSTKGYNIAHLPHRLTNNAQMFCKTCIFFYLSLPWEFGTRYEPGSTAGRLQ